MDIARLKPTESKISTHEKILRWVFDNKFWNSKIYHPFIATFAVIFAILFATVYFSNQCLLSFNAYALCQLGHFFGKYGYGKYDSYWVEDAFYSIILAYLVSFLWVKFLKKNK